jgi:uncharacterized protein
MMDILLDQIETRILGCLIEKESTTPEYYPLSLNALTNACNQKSNRNPVLLLDEMAVQKGIESLKQKGLVRETHAAGSRVTKYLHEVLSRFDLSRHDMAILCELLLRGPQTPGELRSNAGRMAPFETLQEVEETLRALMEHDPQLAVKLSREPGRKESRYMHLFSGEIIPEKRATEESAVFQQPDVFTELKEEVARLRTELQELKKAFEEFKSQF